MTMNLASLFYGAFFAALCSCFYVYDNTMFCVSRQLALQNLALHHLKLSL